MAISRLDRITEALLFVSHLSFVYCKMEQHSRERELKMDFVFNLFKTASYSRIFKDQTIRRSDPIMLQGSIYVSHAIWYTSYFFNFAIFAVTFIHIGSYGSFCFPVFFFLFLFFFQKEV